MIKYIAYIIIGIITIGFAKTGYDYSKHERYIVEKNKSQTMVELEAQIHSEGYRIIKQLKYQDAYVVEGPKRNTKPMEADMAPGVKNLWQKDVVYSIDSSCTRNKIPISPEPKEHVGQMVPSPTNGLWGVWRTQANRVWDKTQGEGIIVCVVDTGIDKRHVDLRDNIWGGEDFTGKGDFQDDNGHGTHVAGIISASNNDIGVVGVAPRSKIWAVKVLDRFGRGYASDIADGIYSCIYSGAHIINLSMGGPFPSWAVRTALEEAKDAGIEIYCAAGNTGGSIQYPAKHFECHAITSLRKGDRIDINSSRGLETAFIAPGKDILSTVLNSNYITLSGTSMATPHASGMAALVMAANKRRIRAVDLGLPHNEQGQGLINAVLSVR